MLGMRKEYEAAFKAKVALEARAYLGAFRFY